MVNKSEKRPTVYEKWPMYVFQEVSADCPVHQVAQVVVEGTVYRLNIIRVVANKVTTGRGSRGNLEHTHDVYHLVMPRSGSAMIKHNGDIVTIHPGEMMVISPGEPHRFMIDEQVCCYTALTFEWVAVSGGNALAIPFHDLLSILTGRPCGTTAAVRKIPEPALVEVFENAYAMARYADDGSPMAAQLLMQLMLQCIGWQDPVDEGVASDVQLNGVYQQLRKGFRSPLNIRELAQTAAMSERTLRRRFKERYGISLKQFQIQLRMEAAKLMLRTTNMHVQEIADEVGYTDLYQFTAAFTKRHGTPPTAFRKDG